MKRSREFDLDRGDTDFFPIIAKLPHHEMVALQVKIADSLLNNLFGILLDDLAEEFDHELYVRSAVYDLWENGYVRLEVLDLQTLRVHAKPDLCNWRQDPYHTGPRFNGRAVKVKKKQQKKPEKPTKHTEKTVDPETPPHGVNIHEQRAWFLKHLKEGEYHWRNLKRKHPELFGRINNTDGFRSAIHNAKKRLPEDKRHRIEARRKGVLEIFPKPD